jgi:hypothetical protein
MRSMGGNEAARRIRGRGVWAYLPVCQLLLKFFRICTYSLANLDP